MAEFLVFLQNKYDISEDDKITVSDKIVNFADNKIFTKVANIILYEMCVNFAYFIGKSVPGNDKPGFNSFRETLEDDEKTLLDQKIAAFYKNPCACEISITKSGDARSNANILLHLDA